MKTITEIFKGSNFYETENIIKTIKVNRNIHAIGIHNILKYYEPDFKIIPENVNILRNLLDYFTGNEKCEYNLNKGIALIGGVGTGKSLIFKAFKDYTREILRNNSFIWHDVKEIIDSVNVKGVSFLNEVNELNGRYTTIYIDDICSTNEIVNNFGTKVNVIENLLTFRYMIFSRFRKLTHFSTNKYAPELREMYGERIIDRMREMFNIVELNCDSFRK